jgi:WD40 repeat protein
MTPRALLLCALTVLGACSDPPGPEPEPETPVLPHSAVLVSSSITQPAGSNAAIVVGNAYVSMVPGTDPDGQRVDIRNLGGGASASALMRNGGFDPIAVAAEAGDTLSVTVIHKTGGDSTTYGIVPLFAKPTIVRTSPGMGKTDVPLNSLMLVVFNQPMDSTSLSDALHLRREGVDVPGSVSGELTGGVVVSAKFTPADSLAPLSTYRFSVSTAAQSLGGVSLDTPLTLEFETASSAAATSGLAFVRNGTVFLSALDGSEPVALVTDAARPAWSPDGTRIAFTRPADNSLAKWQVCLAREDGADVRCVTGADDGYVVGGPSWSPDGAMVAFSVWTHQCPNGECGQFGGFFSKLALLNTLTMTVKSFNTPPVSAVSWSPDGRKIAFAIFGVGTFGRGVLATVNSDGSGLDTLAMSLGSYSVAELTWSPDASRLALILRDENACPWFCDTALGVVNADGTQLRVLDRAQTSNDVYLWAPAWSPDGSHLAYTLSRGIECTYQHVPCGSDITVVGVDGGAIEVLISAGGFPSWRQ